MRYTSRLTVVLALLTLPLLPGCGGGSAFTPPAGTTTTSTGSIITTLEGLAGLVQQALSLLPAQFKSFPNQPEVAYHQGQLPGVSDEPGIASSVPAWSYYDWTNNVITLGSGDDPADTKIALIDEWGKAYYREHLTSAQQSTFNAAWAADVADPTVTLPVTARVNALEGFGSTLAAIYPPSRGYPQPGPREAAFIRDLLTQGKDEG